MQYWPFRELLRKWVGLALDDPELRTRLALRRSVERVAGDGAGDLLPYLALLLGLTQDPESRERLSELSPEALQYRTFEVVHDLFERLAASGPVIVVLEDVHWADPTSLQLAEQLLRVTEDAAVLLVITQRPDPDHPSWRLRELAARKFPHRTRELELQALSGDAERELLHALVGEGTLPPELERRLLGQAEGNPFFLEELLSSLIDLGMVARENGGWVLRSALARLEIPDSVQAVLASRIDLLPPAEKAALQAAAVIGRTFWSGPVYELLEGVEPDLAYSKSATSSATARAPRSPGNASL